jgi:hypothetical protein
MSLAPVLLLFEAICRYSLSHHQIWVSILYGLLMMVFSGQAVPGFWGGLSFSEVRGEWRKQERGQRLIRVGDGRDQPLSSTCGM